MEIFDVGRTKGSHILSRALTAQLSNYTTGIGNSSLRLQQSVLTLCNALERKFETTQLHVRSTLSKEDSNNVFQDLFGIKWHFHNHVV